MTSPELVGELADKTKELGTELVVFTSPLAGELGLRNKKARRNLVETDYAAQLRIFHDLVEQIGLPTLVIPGEPDRDHAAQRTAQIVMRERALQKKEASISLEEAKKSLESTNAQGLEKLRAAEPGLWQETESLLAEVVTPFEYMRGEALRDAGEIEKLAGVRITEFEVLRDAVALVEQGRRSEVLDRYGKVIDDKQLEMLEKILAGGDARPEAGQIVVRDGAKIQLETPDGKPGLTWVSHADFSYSPGTQKRNPLVEIINRLKAEQARGEETANVYTVGYQGRLAAQAVGPDSWVISTPTARGGDDLEVKGYKQHATGDPHAKRALLRRERTTAASLEVADGVDGNIKFRLASDKFREILASQKKEPERLRKVHVISDLQVGSDTMQPEAFVRMLDYALNVEKVDTLVLNGDLIQGQNYPRMPFENEHVGLNQVETQVEFLKILLRPFLEQLQQEGREVEIHVLPGNHEWNTQLKGRPGTMFLDGLAEFIKRFVPNPEQNVHYTTRFEKDGHRIDWPMTRLDSVANDTGFGILAAHCYGGQDSGSKGTTGVPVYSHAGWMHGMGHETAEYDISVGGHFHNPGVTEYDGKFHVLTGACAGPSGFEMRLGYPDGPAGSSILTVSNKVEPEVQLFTDQYCEKQHEIRNPGYAELLAEYEGDFQKMMRDFVVEAQGKNGWKADGKPLRHTQKELD
jgi:predicted phosphodiesterase